MAGSRLDDNDKTDENDERRKSDELFLSKSIEDELAVDLVPLSVVPDLIDARSLMPDPGSFFDELERRGLEYSAKQDGNEDKTGYEGYVRFKLGETELYGIPYRNVTQVMSVRKITMVPCTPSYVCGVINWRGMLLTVLNVSEFFGVKTPAFSGLKKIVVATSGSLTVGILIDSIDGNDVFLSSELEPPLSSLAVKDMSYIEGIHLGCVSILNVNKMLIDENMSGSLPIVF